MEVQTIQQLHQHPTLRNRVARRAYELFIQRGRQMGREAEDWFQAENEILQEVMEEQKHAMVQTLESEVQNQEQSLETSSTTETVAQESNLDNSVPKKRTYTRRKKADTTTVTQPEVVVESAKQVVVEATPTPRTRRTRSKTNVASDIA